MNRVARQWLLVPRYFNNLFEVTTGNNQGFSSLSLHHLISSAATLQTSTRSKTFAWSGGPTTVADTLSPRAQPVSDRVSPR